MGGKDLSKLNFEKALIIVLILILFVSMANIFSQYISMIFNHKEHNQADMSLTTNISFPASLLKADQLFKQEQYDKAQSEYLKLTSMPNISSQQKAAVYFKLGICNYRLKKYDLARDSFLKSAEFFTNDPVAYNNAAVCSFYMGEFEKAEELQKRAIANLPVIEYHYNLARIYEAWGKYGDSAIYYMAVAKAEENITMEDSIDPVRIKNKLMRLMTRYGSIEGITNELMIALRLKDVREVFIINDVDMDIKDKNFKWSISKENDTNRLYCSYDREKSDPYGLIDSLKWTVMRDGKIVYTVAKDKFSLPIIEKNDYTVHLDIGYNTNMTASSYANVFKSSGTYAGNALPNINQSPAEQKCKYYEYAVYEQVFEKGFSISEKGYIDRFNAVWGKDDLIAMIHNKDFIDAQGSIYIKNTTNKRAGIWADLSSLINDKKLKGRTIGIRFYAKKDSEEAILHANIKTKAGKTYSNEVKRYQLNDKWQQFVIKLPIPENADGLTISFKTGAGEEVKIDSFIITK